MSSVFSVDRNRNKAKLTCKSFPEARKEREMKNQDLLNTRAIG